MSKAASQPGGGLLIPATFLLIVGGCCRGVPPENRAVAMQRVNDNLSRIDQPLHCTAWVSFKFRDADGRVHRYLPQDARLDYIPPQSLQFDVRHGMAGTVAQFGSDDTRYWLWIDPEVRKLWWGHWARVDTPARRRLAIPHNGLLDGLMLRPLPESLDGGPPPELQKRRFHHWLVFARPDRQAHPGSVREIRLDRCEPYQPVEIIDRLPGGSIVMHAKLSHYRRVGADGPYTPRKYVVKWPRDDAELRLDIRRARFWPDMPAIEFPENWQGETEQIDAPTPDLTLPVGTGRMPS